MKWLYSKNFSRFFISVCWILMLLFALGFIYVGGYLVVLFMSELQAL